MMELSRRNFLQTAGVVGIAAAAMGLTACSSKTGAPAENAAEETIEVAETKSADIVVVGGGMSGLCAAVSAAGEGKSVIILEQSTSLGGNGLGTEGIFGCGSSMQKEQGIDFTFADCITEEMEFFNYRIDTLAWKDMFTNSASNIDWLMEQGVLIDHVDDYRGMGSFAGFHWWGGFVEDGVISRDGAKNGYITPMSAKAEELGVEIAYGARGKKLIMDNGTVAGIYAELADGSFLQVDAKAVILATGGYMDSDEKVAEMGIKVDGMVRKGASGHNGDGLDMAVAAGGVDTRWKHCLMKEPGVAGWMFETPLCAMGVRLGGPFLFVNQNAERFTNENCTAKSQAYMGNVVATQDKVFCIATQAIMEDFDSDVTPGFLANAEEAVADDAAQAWTANSLDELAGAMGVDAAAFTDTVNVYNTYCAKGQDDDFAKDANMLVAIEEGPFWGFQMAENYFSTLGGISNNRSFEVVNANFEPIPGLYVCGADGCQLYRETYTVLLPASCMGNNINSGRNAGLNAAAYVGALPSRKS
jgi:fumarate reductase flavoprotein subunit